MELNDLFGWRNSKSKEISLLNCFYYKKSLESSSVMRFSPLRPLKATARLIRRHPWTSLALGAAGLGTVAVGGPVAARWAAENPQHFGLATRQGGEVISLPPAAGKPTRPDRAVIYNAGINTSEKGQREAAQNLADTTGAPVYMVNAGNTDEKPVLTDNWRDMARITLQKLTNTTDRRIQDANTRLLNQLAENPHIKHTVMVGVSGGTQAVNTTLNHYTPPTGVPNKLWAVQLASPVNASQHEALRQRFISWGRENNLLQLTHPFDGVARCGAQPYASLTYNPQTQTLKGQGPLPLPSPQENPLTNAGRFWRNAWYALPFTPGNNYARCLQTYEAASKKANPNSNPHDVYGLMNQVTTQLNTRLESAPQ